MADQPLPAPRRIDDAAAAQALFEPLAGEAVEVLAFAYLDRGRTLLGVRHVRSLAVDRIAVPIRAIAGDALAFDACAVVMAHNHPSGDPTPSAADRETTRLVAQALEGLQVRLIDHLIIAARGVTSFRTLGLL
ncbi:JAB domain-containing protein [Sphingomonas xinjiangensis]|uniref:DNA repair protein RadC n=1 Tax=Sphingomonas xinjiangensis TaxID=643568 RepID=A0A840YRK4_9SPHN|nr:JAB domain-containing protein [Sphingomonas xinjiangensis]MBB5711713.1 DNA repair protein RadC [Sphingomonas xinjiangensis]